MKELIFNTSSSWADLIVRLTIGIVLLPHGAQKMLGWFGGYGFAGTMKYFTETRHLPWVVGFMVIVIEFVGGISMILGLGTRLWAMAIVGLMIGIVVTSHLSNGFFMNWYGQPQGEGYEYHLLMIGLALVAVIYGGGRFAVDGLLK